MSEEARSDRDDAVALFVLALGLRGAMVGRAAFTFPPTADGTYYATIADRIAHGFGYTWLWPDGAVTYAAHYPVGYPAMVGALAVVLGSVSLAGMIINALIGALAAPAAYALALRAGDRRVAFIAGALVAAHPALVAYTPALMTEGVTASLVTIAAWSAMRLREASGSRIYLRLAELGAITGVATLVRPQSIVLAPAFAIVALAPRLFEIGGVRAMRIAAGAAAIAAAAAVVVCAPWTARNCVRMKSCALVSVNGGWNLLIGADEESTGAWSPIKVPFECREVFDEAGKDECFGRAARRFIRERPGDWIALAPRKLAATFDYSGAAPWYLHQSNASAFDDRDKVILAAVETAFERIVLIAALAFAARAPNVDERDRRRRLARFGVALAGAISALTLHAWIGYVVLGALLVARGKALSRAPVLSVATGTLVLVTALTHAVFFGAGRYSLVVFPLVTATAALALLRKGRDFDIVDSSQVRFG